MRMLTENICVKCDDLLHADFDEDEFRSFKVGRVRCPECGEVTTPCNECLDENGSHYDCGNCPWKNAEITDAMAYGEYAKWELENGNRETNEEHFRDCPLKDALAKYDSDYRFLGLFYEYNSVGSFHDWLELTYREPEMWLSREEMTVKFKEDFAHYCSKPKSTKKKED